MQGREYVKETFTTRSVHSPGFSEVLEELKDLDEVEVLEIIGAIYEQSKKINEA